MCVESKKQNDRQSENTLSFATELSKARLWTCARELASSMSTSWCCSKNGVLCINYKTNLERCDCQRHILPKNKFQENFVERQVDYARIEHCFGNKLSDDTQNMCSFPAQTNI